MKRSPVETTVRRTGRLALPAAFSAFTLPAALAACALLVFSGPADSQIFGQFTTAGIASDGEGGLFMSTGKNEVHTGAMARFRITSRSDLGFQAGYERFHDFNSFGAGVDFKYYLLGPESTLPVDLAADAALGHMLSGDYGRTVMGLCLMVSGKLIAETSMPMEPYGSAGFYTAFFHDGNFCDGAAQSCDGGDKNDTDTVIRGGLKLELRDDLQLMLEIKLDGTTTFGAALNLVF